MAVPVLTALKSLTDPRDATRNQCFFWTRDFLEARAKFERCLAALGVLPSEPPYAMAPWEWERRRAHLLVQLAACCLQLEAYEKVVDYATQALSSAEGFSCVVWVLS